jgi:hypothetical protein
VAIVLMSIGVLYHSRATNAGVKEGAGFVVSVLLTLAVVAGIAAAWPKDDGPQRVDTRTSTTLMTAEAAAQQGPPQVPPGAAEGPVSDLFNEDPSDVVRHVLEEANDPTQLIELTIFPTYLFVAYVDPDQPDHIDRRMFRDGEVDAASPNPIDDRVDADTAPKLFAPGDLELSRIPALVADAPSH